MKVFDVVRYFDTYPDTGGFIERFKDEKEAKKLANEMNLKNTRPYVSYEVRQKEI